MGPKGGETPLFLETSTSRELDILLRSHRCKIRPVRLHIPISDGPRDRYHLKWLGSWEVVKVSREKIAKIMRKRDTTDQNNHE